MGLWENTPSTSILGIAQVGIAHGPWKSTLPTSLHEHPVRCNRRKASWPHGRAPHPRASTSILRAAQAGIAHGITGERPIHEHTRASCALHMGPWESTPSTSTHEHPVRCTSRDRSWVLGRASPQRAATSTLRPRASTSILGIAQVGIAHGPMGEHPTHKPSRASCALQS